jgi:histidine ammonia-lyase
MMNSNNTLAFNGQPLTIEGICRIAGQRAHAKQSTQTDFLKRILKGAFFIDTHFACGFVWLIDNGRLISDSSF